MKIRFYQTSRRSTEEVLAIMLQRVLQRHNKSLVRCAGKDRALSLSSFLWKQSEFIPHGMADDNFKHQQPILIDYVGEGGEGEFDNQGRENLFLCDGLLPQIEAGGSDLSCDDVILLFDKQNQEVIDRMRDFWKTLPTLPTLPALPNALQEISYWHDNGGKWQKAGEVTLQQGDEE